MPDIHLSISEKDLQDLVEKGADLELAVRTQDLKRLKEQGGALMLAYGPGGRHGIRHEPDSFVDDDDLLPDPETDDPAEGGIHAWLLGTGFRALLSGIIAVVLLWLLLMRWDAP